MQQPTNRTHNPQLTPYWQLENQAPNTTGSNHLYNTLELLMMGIKVPETCWASNKICNKYSSVAYSWHFISTSYFFSYFFNRYLQGFISQGCALYGLGANTLPSHLMDQFHKLLRTNFIISADILSINFNVFNNPPLFFCVLWWCSVTLEDNQDKSKHAGATMIVREKCSFNINAFVGVIV
jgi:hypothetical protein